MAKLVASIFNEYLSVLFEDFSSKNVSSKLFTGKINIQNVNVRKDLLKEILDPVFPNIEVVQALCDSVSVHIPTLHLKSQPVEVKISALHIVLREPVEFTAVSTNLLSKFDKASGGKAKDAGQSPAVISWNAGLAIAFGATVHIDLIDIRLEPLLGADGLRPPMLRLEVMNLKVYSTDEKWRKVPLNKSWELSQSNKDAIQVFKEVSIDSISVSFESEENSSAILTLPLLLRLHLSLSRIGLVPRSVYVEAVVNTCSLKLGSEEVRHLLIFLLSLDRCLQRSNKPEKRPDTYKSEYESSEIVLNTRARSHSAAEAISDITDRFATAAIAEELSRELSSSGVSEAGIDEFSSSSLAFDTGEEINSSTKLVPTFKLRFSAREIRLDLLLGDGDIYIVKVSDCGASDQLFFCVESGPVDSSNDAVLLSSADCQVISTIVNATIAPIIMERLSRISKDQLLPVMTILSNDFSMTFLHPRPPPPQKGFSIRWNLAHIFIAIPLDDCARLYGMIMSDDVLSWICRDPGIFSRLALSGNPPPIDPFDISDCEFDAHLSLKVLDIALPLVGSNLWFDRFGHDKHLQHALRVRIDDILLASGSKSVEKEHHLNSDPVNSLNFSKLSHSGRIAYLSIETAAFCVLLGSTSISRLQVKTQDLTSIAADMPPHSALLVHLPSFLIKMEFPLMPIASNIQDQAHLQVQSLIRLVQIKKAFVQTGHIKHRLFILKSHSNCFPASVFIDWLCECGHATSRDDAVSIGQQFLIHHFFRCVGGSSEDFCDDDSLYRFYNDETQSFKDRHLWLRILAAQEQKVLQAKDGLLDGLNRDFTAHQHIPSGSNPFVLHIECRGKASIVLDCTKLLQIVQAMVPLLELFSLHAGLSHIAMLGLIDMNNRHSMFVHPNFCTCLVAPTHLAISVLLQAIQVRVVLKTCGDISLTSAGVDDRVNMDISIGSMCMTGEAPPDLMMLKMRRLWEDSHGIKPQPIPQLNLKISVDTIGVSLVIPQVASCPLPVIFQPESEGCRQISIDISMSVDGAMPSVGMRSFLDGMSKINKRLELTPGISKDDASSASQKPNIVLVRAKVDGLCVSVSVDALNLVLKGIVSTANCLDKTSLLKIAEVFGSVGSSGLVLLSSAYLTSARMCLIHLISVEPDSVLANSTSIDILKIWQLELKHHDEEQVRSVNDYMLRALWCFGVDFHGSSFIVQFRTSHLSSHYLNVKIDCVAARAALIQQLRSKLDFFPDFSVMELSAPTLEPLMRRVIETFVVLGAQMVASLGSCNISCITIGEVVPASSFRSSEIGFEGSFFLKSFRSGTAVSGCALWDDAVAHVDFSGKDSDGSLHFFITSTFVQELILAFSAIVASAAEIRSLVELQFPSKLRDLIFSSFERRSIGPSGSACTDTSVFSRDATSPGDHAHQNNPPPKKFDSAIRPLLSDSKRSLQAVRNLEASLSILQHISESTLGHSIAPFLAANASSKLTLSKSMPSWAAGVTAKSSDKLATGFPWSHSFLETSLIEGAVRFFRCEKEAVKKGPSTFFNRGFRVDWQTRWAIVRSSGSLLLFDDSNASSPPSVRVDMTFVQYHQVVSDSSKHPSRWQHSSSGDCICLQQPVGDDIFLAIVDDSSAGDQVKQWIDSFRECALEMRVQKAMKDEAAASLARVRAFCDDGVSCNILPDEALLSGIPLPDALPVLVNNIIHARDEAILAHHDLSSARVELEVTKSALASSAQDLQMLRRLLEQREDELRACNQALNDAVLLKQHAVSDASRAKASIMAAIMTSSSSTLSPSVRPMLALPPRLSALGKTSTDDPSDDDEISIALSARVNYCSSDLLAAAGSTAHLVPEVSSSFIRLSIIFK
jgi:hypothetical protein